MYSTKIENNIDNLVAFILLEEYHIYDIHVSLFIHNSHTIKSIY